MWVNSIVNYKKKFIENFIFNEKELDLLFNQYLDYFKVLNDFTNPSNYIVIFHEDLSSKTFYKIAEKLNFEIKKYKRNKL